jgi:hypothetical protein
MPKLYSQSPNDHPYLSCCPERDKIWSLPRTTALHGLPRLMEPGARGGGIIASFPRDCQAPSTWTWDIAVDGVTSLPQFFAASQRRTNIGRPDATDWPAARVAVAAAFPSAGARPTNPVISQRHIAASPRTGRAGCRK